MGSCETCAGGCGNCGGCAKQLELTPPELHLLKALGQIPFLPAARRRDDSLPVYLEDNAYPGEIYTLALQCLEKKRLIEVDYHAPLKHFDYSLYGDYPLRGSIALTARGQQVMEQIEITGIEQE